MTTVQALSDRLFRTWLTPPDAQYAQVSLLLDVAADATELALGQFTIVEDENLLRQGSIVEVDRELYRVTGYNDVDKVVTVIPGEYGTESVAHTAGTMINLAPTYTQQDVFLAIRDNIIQLYPRLYTVNTESLASVSGSVFPIKDDLIVEVIEAWADQGQQDINFDARVVDYHPQASGRAIITNRPIGVGWFRYRRRMAVAQSPTDTLESLGMDSVWSLIVMVGAAADLFAGRDLPASQVEWVGSVLQAESIPVGTRSSLSVGLARYRELLIDRFSKEMRAEDANTIKVHQQSAFGTVT